MQLVRALSFLLGVATFVVGNVVLFVMAYPTMPNPGPQADIRLPLFGLVAAVILITFLLGQVGRAFGAGFAAAFVVELLFMSGCTRQWADPGGTALADARLARRVEAGEAEAVVRAKAKWVREVREHGLDLAIGVHRLELATGCVLAHWKKHHEYPSPTSDSLPELGPACPELQLRKDDETGWRVRYSRVPEKPEDPGIPFLVRAGPDPALGMKGPLLEMDYRGLIFQRDSATGLAFALGSPLQPISAVLIDCIRKNAPEAKPKALDAVLTLRDLVFGFGGCPRIQLEQVKTDGGTVVDDPNVARLYLPTTRAFVGMPLNDISTSWDLTYVPRGRTPADGYDLQVRPMRYGFTGVRSYLLTAGRVHATWKDRPATPSDPLAEGCERNPNTPCGG